MVKAAVISDLHSNIERLDGLLKLIKEKDIDIVLFTGDVIKGKARGDEWLAAQSEGRNPARNETIVDEAKEENKDLVNFYRFFETNQIHIAVIPGNMDAPLTRYYNVINHKLSFCSHLHQVHEGFWPYKGYAFTGFGGTIGPKEEYFVLQSTPEELESLLVPEDQGKLIFLFHQPPTGGAGKVGADDKGHPLINKMIEKHKPELVFVGHSHAQSSQTIGNSLVINPGSLKKGDAAVVDLETKQFEFVKVE
ncbi:MAG: metallophosphoesterase [Candidatus Odinarchaeota archaeon]